MLEKSFTQCALIGCNVSWKNEISEAKLVDILMNRCEIGEWLGHMDVFFNELPKKIIIGVLNENNISHDEVKYVFKKMPLILQGKNFKEICFGD